MPGARRCVSVIFPKLRRGCDGETEGVCDPQLVRGSPGNSAEKLRGGILGKTGTSATGRSFAAREGQRGAGLSADREGKRGIAERGAETAHRGKRSGGIRQYRRGGVHEAGRGGDKHAGRSG